MTDAASTIPQVAEARALLAAVVAASDVLDLLSAGHVQLAAGSLETLCSGAPSSPSEERPPSTDIIGDLRKVVQLLVHAAAEAPNVRVAFCLSLITRQLNDVIAELTRAPT